MAFTKAPISAVITDAVGNTINLGNASGVFTAAPASIVLTDANGNTLNVGPGVVAKVDATAQAANIANTTLYTVPTNSAGMYRLSGYVVITQAATTSSVLPRILFQFTDLDTGVLVNQGVLTVTNSNNTVGTNSSTGGTSSSISPNTFLVPVGGVIKYQLDSYASSGATPMQFAVHIKLEYLGS